MTEVTQVGPQDILGPTSGEVALSPLQKIGVFGTIAVGSLGSLVVIFLLIRWTWLSPSVPILPSEVDDATANTLIQNYTTLSEAVREDTLRIFDSFVVKLLLPIFTSFVGYIFGSHARRGS